MKDLVTIESINTRPLPWDDYRNLPPVHAGGDGPLRYPGPAMIEARDDLDAVAIWLTQRATNEHTRELYRLQAERLLLWASIERGKSLSELVAEDYQAFAEFLLSPQPRNLWVGPRRPRSSPDWRPFADGLSATSRATVLNAINSLLKFLVEARYLSGNPLALTERRPPAKPAGVERFLDESAWTAVMESIEAMPRDGWREQARYERARWLLSLLYLAVPRRSEITGHCHGDIRQTRRGGEIEWWWHLVGKGSKARKVPVSPELVRALCRYRDHLGLAPYPTPDDTTPLVCRLPTRAGPRLEPITSNMVYKLVKDLFLAAAERVEPEDPAMANHLTRASVHWVRHTGITRILDQGEALHHAQKFAGHGKIETTGGYAHAGDRELQEAVARLRLDWPGG